MATSINLSTIIKVDLRDYWQNEATDFTSWLASEEKVHYLADRNVLENLLFVSYDDLTARFPTSQLLSLNALNPFKSNKGMSEYHDRLAVIAEQTVPLDFDDGMVFNYAKLSDVAAK